MKVRGITDDSGLTASEVKEMVRGAGACAVGIAEARPVDASMTESFRRWIAEGRHGGMDYLEKYTDLRSDPRLLLPGARSVIVCAFNYNPGPVRSELDWAAYALGDDYHDVLRSQLSRVADEITRRTGAECRVCVDTAPISERYWAVKAGVGFIGLNCQLIVPGLGSRVLLAEILTGIEFDADEELDRKECDWCGRCVAACPGGALHRSGASRQSAGSQATAGLQCPEGRVEFDARKCLSYLTIEHRGELPDGLSLGRKVYGCDVCQMVCPHNEGAPVTVIEEFKPREAILRLSAGDIEEMTHPEFSAIFRRSAIKRAKLAGLQRNARRLSRFPGEAVPGE